MEDHDELPKNVILFRQIVSNIKQVILQELDDPSRWDKKSAQEFKEFDIVARRIINLGKILISILEKKVHHPNFEPVLDEFDTYNLDLQTLDYDDRKLCKIYVNIDIFTNTFDINGHASAN
jgi:hypothetical protein